MKKTVYFLWFVLIGMNLAAQSVWDGRREAIRNGSGTENDPYLIENAQNLAWLAYLVNWDYSHWTEGKYFLLTTDIDLNGSHDNQWIPIGSGPSADDTKFFKGIFDGGFHKITGLYIDTNNPVDDNNSIWVTGYVGFFAQLGSQYDSKIKNLYLEGAINSKRKTGGFSGHQGCFEYCINNVEVESSDNCAGGIVGLGPATVDNCANFGNIKGNQGVGGIVGFSGDVENCYNTGKIEGVDNVGGIAGRTLFAKNCYNVGDIVHGAGAVYKGGITGNDPSGVHVYNCYYLEGCIDESNAFGEPKTVDFMRSQEFVNLLNNETDVWAYDENNTNNGYPVFGDTQFAVNENFIENTDLVTLYPNPGNSQFNISTDLQDASIKIYDINGKLVYNRQFINNTTIYTANWPYGIYLWKVISDGREVESGKWVKQ